MKLQFKHQAFQRDAARAVTDVFTGQKKTDGFTYRIDQGRGQQSAFEFGIRNEPIMLDRTSLVQNIRDIQMSYDIEPISDIVGEGLNLSIEMETGTGKTYTYIKTMYELNKLYGWSKFIIVVPSVPIREGVVKSIDIMRDHFAQDYNGKRLEYFVYDSKDLTKIEGFAIDTNMHVMIINTHAFNARDADARKFTSVQESFQWRKPVDVIAATNPILIIDEPQSVLGVDRKNATREKLKDFNALFTLLYSATHRKDDVYNQVYRLDAIDAINKKLVKKIEVFGVTQQGDTATNGYVYLEKIVPGKNGSAPQARIEFDTKTSAGIKTVRRLVGEKFDLYDNSDKLEEYKDGFVVDRIDGVNGCIHLLNNTTLYEGDVVGAVNEDVIRRIQIRETIKKHIERERDLYRKGIKVLSLFFIDHVENYRVYGKGKDYVNGKFADMFEEEYRKVLSETQLGFDEEKYSQYLANIEIEKTHNGYFSKDKEGKFVNPKPERNSTDSEDVDAYRLIMKDKETLLSLDKKVKGSEVRFIFSHSALKEGWDNPNVFQICTLKNSDNETKKRQEVGRGMRLCVNQQGERQDEESCADASNINILTVIASESYDDFARKLQDELAKAVTSRPVIVTPILFTGRTIVLSTGIKKKISEKEAAEICEELVINGYVKKGALTKKYHDEHLAKTLYFGDWNLAKDSIVSILDKIFDPHALSVGNARRTSEARFDYDKFNNNEFQTLWKHINKRTFYTVDFETKELVDNAIKELDNYLNVTELHIKIGSGTLDSIRDKEELETGTAMKAGKIRTIKINENIGINIKYDLIGKLVGTTGLTRRCIVDILTGIKVDTFHQYKLNPEEFIIKASNCINRCKALAVIQHIEYHKLNETFDSDIFTESTIRGKLGVNAIESTKSLYDLVVVDSMGIEKEMAESLEKEDEVAVYTKLPKGFYINTPMGHYNPDWAIVFKEGYVNHVYFVAETKGALGTGQNRGVEESKIECARRHFTSISDKNIVYDVVSSYDQLRSLVVK